MEDSMEESTEAEVFGEWYKVDRLQVSVTVWQNVMNGGGNYEILVGLPLYQVSQMWKALVTAWMCGKEESEDLKRTSEIQDCMQDDGIVHHDRDVR